MKRETIWITDVDMELLLRLVDSARWFSKRERPNVDILERELDRAEVVGADQVPPDVVTMNSTVRIRDLDSGEESVYTLVYPQDAEISANRISVLAPIGTAILGYRAGDVVQWEVPSGRRRLKIEEVLFQPEAEKLAA
jgi:regulator of nucleoside diphosphate kinase